MISTPQELDKTAAELQASGDLGQYLTLTEALVAAYPKRADVHLHRARALAFAADRRLDALSEVDAAIGLTREEPQELMRLAAVLIALGELERADEFIRRAVRAAGLTSAMGDPSMAYLAGMAAYKRGEDSSAKPLLEAAVAADPGEADYARDLARLYVRIGHTAKARAVAARALEAAPGDERLRRLATPVRAEVYGERWRAAVAKALDGDLDGLLCPVYGDGDLIWTPVRAEIPDEDCHRLYCPMCGAEVLVNVGAADAP